MEAVLPPERKVKERIEGESLSLSKRRGIKKKRKDFPKGELIPKGYPKKETYADKVRSYFRSIGTYREQDSEEDDTFSGAGD